MLTLLHTTLAAGLAVALALPAIADAQTTVESRLDQVRAHFEEADADDDGALTLEEFKTLISLNAEDRIGRSRAIQRRGREADAFERLDADADGLVTKEEVTARID